MGRYYNPQAKQVLREQQFDTCGSCYNESNYMEAHHIVPVWAGGSTNIAEGMNGVMLCKPCHINQDNLNVVGELWGDIPIEDCDSSQIEDWVKYERALEQVELNRTNPDLVKKIYTKHLAWQLYTEGMEYQELLDKLQVIEQETGQVITADEVVDTSRRFIHE